MRRECFAPFIERTQIIERTQQYFAYITIGREGEAEAREWGV